MPDPRHSAELVIVDQVGDLRVWAADLAVGVLLQLDILERHLECIIEKQPPGQRSTYPQQEFDGFSGLDGTDGAG